jgi:hypothetical protein
MKPLLILTETLFLMLLAAQRKPPVKISKEPLHVYLGGFFLHQMRGDHGRKSTNDKGQETG